MEDLERAAAGIRWIHVASDWLLWKSWKEVFVEQWTSSGLNDDDDKAVVKDACYYLSGYFEDIRVTIHKILIVITISLITRFFCPKKCFKKTHRVEKKVN